MGVPVQVPLPAAVPAVQVQPGKEVQWAWVPAPVPLGLLFCVQTYMPVSATCGLIMYFA